MRGLIDAVATADQHTVTPGVVIVLVIAGLATCAFCVGMGLWGRRRNK